MPAQTRNYDSFNLSPPPFFRSACPALQVFRANLDRSIDKYSVILCPHTLFTEEDPAVVPNDSNLPKPHSAKSTYTTYWMMEYLLQDIHTNCTRQRRNPDHDDAFHTLSPYLRPHPIGQMMDSTVQRVALMNSSDLEHLVLPESRNRRQSSYRTEMACDSISLFPFTARKYTPAAPVHFYLQPIPTPF